MSKIVNELWDSWTGPETDNYALNVDQINSLFTHTRKLEAMLEWACDTISDDHGEFYEGCHKCEKLAEARKLIE